MPSQFAVLFDVDGVLVDSYQAHFLSWQKLAAEEGRSMSEAQFVATFGRTSREIIAELWSDAGYDPQQITALDQRKEQLYRDTVAAEFPLMPGALELIDALAGAGFALAVGSSGPAENVELALDHLGRRDVIGAAVTGNDVSRGKPDPQVFQIAAERLGVPARACAVVEDASAGIAAANAAGMVSIALVSSGHRREEFAAADHLVDRLAELNPDRIGQWIAANIA